MIKTIVENGCPIELHVKNGEKMKRYELFFKNEKSLFIVKDKNEEQEITEKIIEKCIKIGTEHECELLIFANERGVKKEENVHFKQKGMHQINEDGSWFRRITQEHFQLWSEPNFYLFLQNKKWKNVFDLHKCVTKQLQEEEKETITLEYRLVNVSPALTTYRIYFEGVVYWLHVRVEKHVTIELNQKRRSESMPSNIIWEGTTEEIDEKEIKEKLHNFLKKIKEKQRIKNIYNPPTHHQEEMVKELIRPMEYRVQLLEWIKTIYQPLELEQICARWKKEKKVEAHRYPLIEEGTLHIGFFGPHAVLLHEHEIEKQIFYFKNDQQGAIETYEKMLKKDLEKEKIRQEKSINQLKKLRFS